MINPYLKKEVERITNIIEFECGLEKGMIHSKDQDDNVRIPRQFAHYIVREKFGRKISFEKIGWLIGNKDHATILNSIKQVSNLMETEQYYRSMYNMLLKAIYKITENLLLKEVKSIVLFNSSME